jgi:hypothetical protein
MSTSSRSQAGMVRHAAGYDLVFFSSSSCQSGVQSEHVCGARCAGVWLDTLSFTTSKGTTHTFGQGNALKELSWSIPAMHRYAVGCVSHLYATYTCVLTRFFVRAHRAVAFRGGVGGHLHNLACTFAPGTFRP